MSCHTSAIIIAISGTLAGFVTGMLLSLLIHDHEDRINRKR